MFINQTADNPIKKFDLQLFAEGEGGSDAATGVASSSAAGDGSLSSFLQGLGPIDDGAGNNPEATALELQANPPAFPGSQPAAGGEPGAQPVASSTTLTQEPAQNPLSSIPGLEKFESVEDLAKSYLEAQKKLTEMGQGNSQLQKQIETLASQIEALQQQGLKPAQPETPAAPQFTPEQIKQFGEEWLNEFYENPLVAMTKILAPMIQQQARAVLAPELGKVEPLLAHFQEQQQIKTFAEQAQAARQKYPDFDAHKDAIEKVLEENEGFFAALPPEVNIMDAAYQMAKGRSAKTLDQYLSDPQALQVILNNPQIRNEILKQNAQAIKEGQPPPIIGTQPAGGQPPVAPPAELKTRQDVKKATLSFFQRVLGNSGAS